MFVFQPKLLNKLPDFHETVYGKFEIGENPTSMLLNFLQSAVTVKLVNL